MRRGPRLDAPGALHHVMARGLERRVIFRDERDRRDFIDRLAALAAARAVAVYAWALLPNHFHLLLRTGQLALARAMRSLLTGYAGAFNRRHRRHGHRFQNRYKSVVRTLPGGRLAAVPPPGRGPGRHPVTPARAVCPGVARGRWGRRETRPGRARRRG